MSNSSHLQIFLECVADIRHFSELYTKATRINFPHIDYNWVAKIRNQAKSDGYVELKKGNNYIIITKKGREYLQSQTK